MPVTFVPVKVGDVLRISSSGSRVEVVSPSDLRFSVPAPEGYIDLWMAEAGVWDVDGTDITVQAADPADPPRPQRSPLAELSVVGGERGSHFFHPGDAVTLRQSYRDPLTLAPVDPDIVRFRLWREGWAEAEEIDSSKVVTGLYEGRAVVWEGGDHYVEVESSGGWRAITRLTLKVAPAVMPS